MAWDSSRLVIYYSQSITITFENIQSITITITFENLKSITITITLASITSITFYYIILQFGAMLRGNCYCMKCLMNNVYKQLSKS